MTGEKQAAYLEALGITRWVRRDVPPAAPPRAELAQQDAAAVVEKTVVAAESPAAAASPSSSQTGAPVPAELPPETDSSIAIERYPVSEMGWPALREAVSICTACDLAQGRTKTVFGTGDEQANWLIIGEAPGQQEDLQGEPFVGRAGLLLTNMLLALGLKRESVYIANVVKCRPPQNRDPRPEEITACSAYLARQVELLQPKLVLVVGRIAAQHLLDTQAPVGRLRGSVHRYPGTDIPLVVTYHPAYLLRRPSEKRKSWDDLRLAMRAFEEGNAGL